VPNFFTHSVARGAMTKAMEMDNPPTKANSRELAPGNVSVDK
jgi:hypothetical protein